MKKNSSLKKVLLGLFLIIIATLIVALKTQKKAEFSANNSPSAREVPENVSTRFKIVKRVEKESTSSRHETNQVQKRLEAAGLAGGFVEVRTENNN